MGTTNETTTPDDNRAHDPRPRIASEDADALAMLHAVAKMTHADLEVIFYPDGPGNDSDPWFSVTLRRWRGNDKVSVSASGPTIGAALAELRRDLTSIAPFRQALVDGLAAASGPA